MEQFLEWFSYTCTESHWSHLHSGVKTVNLPTLMGFPPPRNVEVATAATVSMRIQLKSSSTHSFHVVLDINRGSTERENLGLKCISLTKSTNGSSSMQGYQFEPGSITLIYGQPLLWKTSTCPFHGLLHCDNLPNTNMNLQPKDGAVNQKDQFVTILQPHLIVGPIQSNQPNCHSQSRIACSLQKCATQLVICGTLPLICGFTPSWAPLSAMATFPRGISLGSVNCTDYTLQYFYFSAKKMSHLHTFSIQWYIRSISLLSPIPCFPIFDFQEKTLKVVTGHTCQETGFTLGNLVHSAHCTK